MKTWEFFSKIQRVTSTQETSRLETNSLCVPVVVKKSSRMGPLSREGLGLTQFFAPTCSTRTLQVCDLDLEKDRAAVISNRLVALNIANYSYSFLVHFFEPVLAKIPKNPVSRVARKF